MRDRFSLSVWFMLLMLVAGCDTPQQATPPREEVNEPATDLEEEEPGGEEEVPQEPAVNEEALTSIEFRNQIHEDPDSMVGKTWKVRGFLNFDHTMFRADSSEPIEKKSIIVEFRTPPAQQRHPQKEATVQGVAALRGKYVVLEQCDLLSEAPDPEGELFEVADLVEQYRAAPEYTRLRLNSGLSNDDSLAFQIKLRGKVINVSDSASVHGSAFLNAGEGAVVEVMLSDESETTLSDIHAGKIATFLCKFFLHQTSDEKIELRFHKSELVSEEDAPVDADEPNGGDDVATFTAIELVKQVTTDGKAFLKSIAAGGTKKPIVVTGVVQEVFPFGGTFDATINLAADGVHGKIKRVDCKLAEGESIDGVKVGDTITMVGNYAFTLNAIGAVSLENCRVQ